jgi:NCS1 family nucleobase:cation symporter-1
MFLGHYVAWICAALLLIYWVKEKGVSPQEGKDPGTMVNDAVGWAGLVCIIIAGWTTANPTIYRAGLAFQGVLPALSRTGATLLAGAVCIAAGIFPAFAMRLLDFVGVYGTILAPVGGLIVVDHFLADRVGIDRDPAEKSGTSFNMAVLVAWLVPVLVGLSMTAVSPVNPWGFEVPPWYLPLPCTILCGVLYILLSKLAGGARRGGRLATGA